MKKITLLLALTMSVHLSSSYYCYSSRYLSAIPITCNDDIKYESTYIHHHLVLLKYEGTALTEYILVQRNPKSKQQEYQSITNVCVSEDGKQLSIEYADKRYTVYHLDKIHKKKNHKPCMGITVYKDTEGMDKEKIIAELKDTLSP